MLSNKIKGILAINNIKIKDFAAKLKIRPTSLSSKIQNNTWLLNDIVTLAKEIDARICIVDNKTEEVIMTITTEDMQKLDNSD